MAISESKSLSTVDHICQIVSSKLCDVNDVTPYIYKVVTSKGQQSFSFVMEIELSGKKYELQVKELKNAQG